MPINEYDEILSNVAVGNNPTRSLPVDQNQNEYDSILNEDRNIQKQNIQQNLVVAKNQNEETRAKAIRLGQKLNISPAIIERNMSAFEEQDSEVYKDYDRVIDKTPGLAKWLENPDNAVLGKNDIQNLGNIEQGVRLIYPGKEAPNAIVNSVRTGWNGLENAAAHVGAAYGLVDIDTAAEFIAQSNIKGNELKDKAPQYSKQFYKDVGKEFSDLNKQVAIALSSGDDFEKGNILDALKNFGSGSIGTVGEALDVLGVIASNPRGFAYSVGENIANSFPSLATRAAGIYAGAQAGAAIGLVLPVPGAAATLGTFGGLAGMFAGGAPIEIGSWINQALQERGVDITNAQEIRDAYKDPTFASSIRAEAERKGFTTAGVDSLFGFFSGKFLSASKLEKAGISSAIKAGAKDLAVESFGESASEFAGQVAARKGDLSKVDYGDVYFEGLASLGHSFGDIALGSSVKSVRTAFSKDTAIAAKQVAVKAKSAIQATEAGRALGDIGKAVKDSKVGKLIPEKIKELVSNVSGKEESNSVFFQADDWDNHFKKKGKSPAKAAEQLLGDGGRSYMEAKEAGGMIEVPFDDFVSKVGPTQDFEELQGIVRTSPDGMSVTESEDFLKSLPATMEELANEAQNQTPQEISAENVQKEVESKLVNVGIQPETAQQYSQIYQAAFQSLGERVGIDPQELYNRFGLNINTNQKKTDGEVLFQKSRGDWKKEGYEISKPYNVDFEGADDGEAESFFKQNPDLRPKDFLISAPNGEHAGSIRIGLTKDQKNIYVWDANIEPEHRRKGIATEVYVRAEKLFGKKLIAGVSSQSEDAIGLWSQEDRPFGVLFQSPKKPVPEQSEIEALRAKVKEQESQIHGLNAELRTSEVTGLRNKRAFDEDASLGWPVVAAMDMDGLKKLNDTIGHEQADIVLKTLGETLLKAQGEGDNVRFYHRSGDEFAGRFKNEAEAESFMTQLQQALESVNIELDLNDGTTVVYEGIGLSYGTANDYQTADQRASQQKVERFKSGQREDARAPGPSKRVKPLETKRGSEGDGSSSGQQGSLEQDPSEYGYTDSYDSEDLADAIDDYNLKANLAGDVGLQNDVSEIGFELRDPSSLLKFPKDEKRGWLKGLSKDQIIKEFKDKYNRRDISLILDQKEKVELAPVILIDGDLHDGFGRTRLAHGLGEPVAVSLFSSNPDDDILFQPGDQGPRGQIRFGDASFNIDLLKDADLSTFLHETGHFYTEVLGALSKQENIPDQIKNDFETLVKWAGFESVDQWNKTDLEGRRSAHEKIARGFEAYLMEGKAPTSKLQAAFDRFKTWLTSIYKTVTGLDVQLSDEVRDVFNRLLATDEQLKVQNEEFDTPPMFLENSGMSEDERKKYFDAISSARRRASEELSTKALDTVRRSKTKEWKEHRKRVRSEIESEVNKQKPYIALSVLQRGTMPDGSPAQGLLSGIKISRQALVDSIGAERTKNLPKPYIYTRDGGIHQDQAAELLGFSSGDEMIRAIESTPKKESLIDQLTDAKMKKDYGDIISDASFASEAEKALANKSKSQRLHLELKHLASDNFAKFKGLIKRINRTPPPLEAIRTQAESTIGSRKVRNITPGVYKRAEAKHAKEAMDSLLRGDIDGAFLSKQRELFNHELHRAALNAQTEVNKTVKFLSKFTKKEVRQRLGKAGGSYLDQIDQLMERFDLRKGISLKSLDERVSLRNWVESQREQNIEPVISEDLLNEANKQHYKDLTFNQFQEVKDAVKNINHLATLKNVLLASKKVRDYEIAKGDVLSSIVGNAKKTMNLELEPRLKKSRGKDLIKGFFAEHRKFSEIAREMDGFKDGGSVWEYFVRPLNDAANRENEMKFQAMEDLKKLYSVYDAKEIISMSKTDFIPEINASLSKTAQLATALNWGNEDNRTKFMAGHGFNRSQVEAILNKLTKKDWDFVQSVWNYFNGDLKKQSFDLERRVNGIAPKEVKASPVKTKFGTYDGGYYPAKYETLTSINAGKNEAVEAAKQMMRGAAARSMTKSGHRKERVQGVVLPMRLDLGVIGEHVSQVIHDVTHYEAIIDMTRFLNDRDIKNAIQSHYGKEIHDQLRKAVDYTAAGDKVSSDSISRIIRHLRNGVTTSVMGFSVQTALQQPLGFSNSINYVGAKWVAKGLKQFIGGPSHMQQVAEMVNSKSAFMRNRARTLNVEISDVRNKLPGVRSLPSSIKDSFFYLTEKTQQFVDIPTWIGAYEKAIESNPNDESRAVSLADQAVIASQGSGNAIDQASVQVGSEVIRLFTNFMSYFNATLQRNIESVKTTDFKDPASVGRFAVDQLVINVMPAVLGLAMMGAIKGEDVEDEDILPEISSWYLGNFALVRELSGFAKGFYGYGGPAGTRFFTEFGNVVKELKSDDFDSLKFTKALNRSGGILFHYPAAQLERTVKGIDAVRRGEAGPQAILTGPPRN